MTLEHDPRAEAAAIVAFYQLFRADREQGTPRPLAAFRLARFLDEAMITGRLGHPGIVPVHDLGIADEGRVFYTMPVIEGASAW